MNKLKQTIEKALEKTYWVNSEGHFKHVSDYPQEFEQKFGNISTNTIFFDNYLIDNQRIDDLHKFLNEHNFNVTQQYRINEYKSGYYFNDELKMMMKCNFGSLDEKVEKEIDDEDTPISAYETSVVSFQFCPLIQNKNKILKFLYDLIDLNIIFLPQTDKNFYIIAQNANGLYKQKTSFNNIEIKDGRYDIYYGDKFKFDKFKRFMKDSNTESLLLLHGDPGAGKSNLLKNLILEAEEDVIYVPPSMVSVISSPGFIPFMIQNSKNFLIIEDAEEILSTERNSGTNNLLGICDGFLKDALKLKIICTFNCDLKKVDPALLRKGRLYFEHKFTALTIEEGQRLVDFCNLDIKVDKEMTLSEIFNYDKEISVENSFEERSIGFGNF